jgi:hypothetical protein
MKVTKETILALLFGPSPIPVHDYGDMAGKIIFINFFQ